MAGTLPMLPRTVRAQDEAPDARSVDYMTPETQRAIDRGLQLMGEKGLPLIGSGDWNDGMDKVGQHGKGESVWLAFFLYEVLMRFSEVAAKRNDNVFSAKCIKEAEKLRANVDEHAWDGEWYCRAFFDDGTPLGSSRND